MRKTLLGLAFLGCSTLQNTPAQDRTWAAYNACRAENRTGNIQVTRVDPEGRYWWNAPDHAVRTDFNACMAEKLRLKDSSCATTRCS
jgi:hypothetical protein